jgi:hypothetical protein
LPKICASRYDVTTGSHAATVRDRGAYLNLDDDRRDVADAA